MERLQIVCVNAGHSRYFDAVFTNNDKEWVNEILRCVFRNIPMYVTPRSRDTYLFKYFVEQTLNQDGYVTPGNYVTEAPGLGEMKYSIWNERSDYPIALIQKDNNPKE